MKTYYLLTKPKILMGNLITTIAGFALASTAAIFSMLFLETLIGLGLVIASACVCNNYIDRYTDQKMKRTQSRPLVKGLVSNRNALTFAVITGLSGLAILAYFANPLAAITALIGFLVYVGFYSLLKYQTTYATLVGSISGAIPPVVGYVAVSGRLDLAAWLLFAILVLWQMPHFYSIAIYLFDDYSAASIPVLPITRGIKTAKWHIFFYIIAFLLCVPLLTIYGYTGYAYLVVALASGTAWLWLGYQGFKAQDDAKWARSMFVVSLVTIIAISVVITISSRI